MSSWRRLRADKSAEGAMAREGLGRTVALALVGAWALLGQVGVVCAADAIPDAAALRRVMPEASAFGAFGGNPPSAPAFVDGRAIGYVFRTWQVIGSTGYSRKPLDVLVGIDMEAHLTGATILQHQEPILVIGVSETDLAGFVAQYRGRDIREPIRIERAGHAGDGAISAVSGATVSSIAINDAILHAARVVARARGLLKGSGGLVDTGPLEPADWQALVADGSIRRLTLTVAALQAMMARRGLRYFDSAAAPPGPDETFLELYAALATPGRIGRNLLGEPLYNRVLGEAKAGDQLLFIAGRGLYSFKGTSYRRTGHFDRIQLVQGERTIALQAGDYVRVDDLSIAGHPPLREMALFVLRGPTGFRPEQPWRLDIAVDGHGSDGAKTPVVFSLDYTIPARYRAPASVSVSAAASMPDPTSATASADAEEPSWIPIWHSRVADLAVLITALITLSAVLFFQDVLAQRPRLYQAVRIGFLLFTVLWIGWYASAQLSVINVMTFADALRTGFRWEFFLLEPLIFILWGYVAVTMIFWGRGVFCGWLCPFGALQELLNKLARRLRIPQINLPFSLHERLWPVKYVIFICLFGLSLGGLAAVQALTEVEPFKTAIVLKFHRGWPFVLYAGALLVLGLFVERFFCRYLCPLGAALAIPARIRMFEWLKRRWQCGLQCHICARTCPVQAIHPDGHINPNECIHCLNCQVLYYDDTTCPPLVERRRRRNPQMDDRLIKRFAAAERDGAAAGGKPGEGP
jgi:NosR/NirI family transcriptional regulator, nitrous oxide reductase regulator